MRWLGIILCRFWAFIFFSSIWVDYRLVLQKFVTLSNLGESVITYKKSLYNKVNEPDLMGINGIFNYNRG